MKRIWVFSIFAALFFVSFSINQVYAQSTFTINIPTGAASPDAPFFWQSEKDGDTSGKIEIKALDTVVWENADTAAHTVTSGSLDSENLGEIFDSGLFNPGKEFKHQFTEIGSFPYVCVVHPWMDGVVVVTSGLKIIPNVGAGAGDGKTTFDVEYQFNRVVSKGTVNEEQKSVTFEIVGRPMGDDNNLTLHLPKNLIKGPYVVWADGTQVTNFEQISEGGINIVKIPLKENSELLTIVGTSVVPEFGALAGAVLVITIISVIILSRTKTFSKF